MSLRVRLTRSTTAALCCLMTILLTFLGPSQVFAVQGNDGGRQPTGHQRAVESASRSSASHVQHLHLLPAPQAHPLPLQAAHGAQAAALQATYGRLPLSFELNDGQTNGQVKALARGAGYALFLTNAGATLALVKRQAPSTQKGLSPRLTQPHRQSLPFDRLGDLLGQNNHAKVTESGVRLTFVGANPHPQVVGLDKLPGVSNYFIGNDHHKWRTNVAHYAKIEYKNVYPGISLVYYGNQRQLEYDWVVEPGANAAAVRLAVQRWGRGADESKSSGARLDKRGNLLIHTASGDIVQGRPVVYQDVAGRRRAVNARYTFTGTDRVGFAVGAYDTGKPLVIDPVLAYSTSLGGSADDEGLSITVDAAGNVYVTGATPSTTFPTVNAFQSANAGNFDVFVTKLNVSGSALIYSTYLGGNADDVGCGIVVDQAGDAYVTGRTYSTDFPTINAIQLAYGGGIVDAFVTKLNPSGSALIYSTYLGGSGDDYSYGIAVDQVGDAYVTGGTDSSNFPIFDALQSVNHGSTNAFVTMLNPSGSALIYSTYLGGNGSTEGHGIVVDAMGNAYVTGVTNSNNFPIVNALQPVNHGGYDGYDAFVSKLNSGGNALVYSTYLGGSGDDYGNGIVVDAAGNTYVTGYTQSSDFPTANALQPASGGGDYYDAFVTKLNASGNVLVYSTYLGGSNTDEGQGIAVDQAGDAYVTGQTSSTDFPTVNALQPAYGGNYYDAFAVKLNVSGNALVYSTYLGGNGDDYGYGIAVNQAGDAYVTGQTYSTNFPTVNALQHAYGRGAFVTKIGSYGGPGRAEIRSLSEKDTTCSLAQTVSCATGDFWHTVTDLAIPGRGIPLNFTRTYNSVIANQNGPLGYGWTDNYNMFLTQDISGNVGVNEEGGTTVVFSQTAPGVYQAPSRVLATLTPNGDGTLTFARQDQEHFTFTMPTTTTTGQLVKEVDRNGYATTLNYVNGLLSTVTDPAGRQLNFSYYTTAPYSSCISAITDPAGRSVNFFYDASDNLATAFDVNGGHTSFTYYSGTHLLQTMTDPNGGVLTNTYDPNGRVITQNDPLNRTTAFSYTPDGTTTITDTLGNVMIAHYSNNVLLSETKGVGTPRQATWAYTYDPTTLGLTAETDPNGHTSHNTWDARGNLLSHTDALGRTTSYAYDALNDTTAITDPLSVTTAMTYDVTGNLLAESRPLTQAVQIATTTLSYDPAHPGDMIARTDPNGHTSHYAYDGYGNLTSASDPLNRTTTARYDLLGRMIARVSPNGNAAGANPLSYTTTMAYNAFGETTAITDALGHMTAYQYDADQNLQAITDTNTHVTSYSYDPDNERTSVTRPDSTVVNTGYDGDGNVITTTDALGRLTSYGYDPLNRPISVTDPLGRTTIYGYDLAGNRTAVTDPLSHTTRLGYDNADEVLSLTRPDGVTLGRGYDLAGRVITTTSGLGYTTRYTYDSLDRLSAVTDPLKRTTQYGYDLGGNRTAVTDPLTRTTTYGYDLADEPITVTRADNSVLLTGFDADGNAIARTDPRNDVSTAAYDPLDRLIAATDPLSHTTTYQYDPAGNRTRVTDPLGHSTAYQYDAMDRVVTTTDPLSQTTVYGYDAMGNRTAVTDPLTQTTRYGYDGDNEQTTITRTDGTTLTTGFDGAGHVLARIDALGHSTTYGYDSLNRVITATDPLGRPTSYGYDRDGNRASLTDALNRVTGYQYDAADQMLGITYSLTTTPAVKYTYTLAGQRQTMKDGTGTTKYSYDLLDRPITITNGANQTLGYRYDPSGNLTTLLYPTSGQVVTRTYDQVNRLSGVQDWLKHTTTFGYDAANNLITQTYPNTTTALFGYDKTDRLIGITDTTPITALWRFGYGRDGVGKLTATADPVDKQQHAYGYDPLNQLTGDTRTGALTGTTSWGYNAAQDLTAITDTLRGVTTTLGYDNADEATSLTAMSGTKTLKNLALGYNADGDRTSQSDSVSGTVTGYGYDQADRPITATVGITTASYKYNGDGLRQSKTVSGTTTAETWDTAAGLPLLVQDGSTRYIPGPNGLPLEQIDSKGNALYYYQDQEGSTRGLLNGAGQTVATASYDPYGNRTAISGTVMTPFGYAGQYTDAETGLQYLRARYYDRQTAQFLTRDPLLDLTGQPYAYGMDSPLDMGDPSGLNPCDSGSSILTLFITCPLYHGVTQGSAGLRVTGPASGAVAASLDALHASRHGPLGAAMRGLNALNNDPGFRAATMPIAAPVGDFIGRTVEGVAPFVAIGDPEDGLLAGLARLGEAEAAHLATAALAHDAEHTVTADAERVTTADAIPVEHQWRYDRYLNGPSTKKLGPDEWYAAAQRVWANNARGNTFEQAVRTDLGAPLGVGSKPVSIQGFVPDLPVGGTYGVTDVKNWVNLTNSDQLRAFHQYAVDNGMPFNLIIGPRTQAISEPLLDNIRQTGGSVMHYDPTTREFTTVDIGLSGLWEK